MSATRDILRQRDAVDLAFSLVLDGYDYVATTTEDVAGLAAAYAATDWTTFRSGLDVVGHTDQRIDAFQPQVRPSHLEFRVLDADGTLGRLLFGAPPDVVSTHLQQTLVPTATSARVADTTDLPSEGVVYVGLEAMEYSGKTGGPDPTLTGLSRGLWSLFGPEGGGGFGRRHEVRAGVQLDRTSTPEVRTAPHTWYNRLVGLVLHHSEPSGDGGRTWSAVTLPVREADAQLVWAGRIKEWEDAGDGWILVRCVSVDEMLLSSIWLDQYQATLHDGGIIRDAQANVMMWQGGSSSFLVDTTLDGSGTFPARPLRYDELRALIQSRFSENQPDGTKHGGIGAQKWTIELRQLEAGWRVVVEVVPASAVAAGTVFWWGASPAVLHMLGFRQSFHRDPPATSAVQRDCRVVPIPQVNTGRTLFQVVADAPPATAIDPAGLRPGDAFSVRESRGIWRTQPSMPEDTDVGAHGFVKLGDRVFAANYGPGTDLVDTFSVKYSMQPAVQESAYGHGDSLVIEEPAPALEVRQLWNEVGTAGKLLLRLLLSTGTAGYNSTDYDVYAEGFGLGIPYDLVDVPSFEALDAPWELYLDTSEPLGDLLEEILAAHNRHLVFRGGRLTLTPPGFDAPEADGIELLDMDSMASVDDRPRVRYGTDGIINRLQLEYTSRDVVRHGDWAGQVTRGSSVQVTRGAAKITVADATSESDFGHRRTLQIKARGLLDPAGWARYVAEPAITYYARPHAQIDWPISVRQVHRVPGDIVQVVHPHIVDPFTGARGVTGLAAWVRGVGFDWQSMAGRLELVFLPTHPASRYARWAPAAEVDETESSGDYDAGYDPVAHRLKLKPKVYGRAGDPADVTFFRAGDAIQVKQISPTNPVSPTVLTGTIASVDAAAHVLQLDGALTGTWNASLVYAVESRAYGAAQTSQRAAAYLADASDPSHLLGGAAPAKLWAGELRGTGEHDDEVEYSEDFVRPSDTDGATDEPLSSRKAIHLAESLNNLLAHKTRNVLVSEAHFRASRSTTSTTFSLAWGPVWVPLYGTSRTAGQARRLFGRVLLFVGTATTIEARLISSTGLVRGASDTALIYDWLSRQVTVSHSTSGYAWVEIPAFAPVPGILDGEVGTFLSLLIRRSAGSSAARAHGLVISEEALS